MGPLDAINHVLNFLFPAFGVAAIAAGGAKLVWRRELAAVRWAALVRDAALINAAVLVAGLVAFRHDGRIATYGAMVLACAVTLWWRGFLSPARRAANAAVQR